MSSSVTVEITETVTIEGTSKVRTFSKTQSVEGRYIDTGIVQVAVASVKVLFDLTDTSDSTRLTDSAGSNGGFKYARVYCVDAEDAADITFVELIVNEAGDDETIRFALPKGWTLIIGDDGGLTGGTDGQAVYASVGTVDVLDCIRVINRSAGTVAKFEGLLVR